MSDSELLEHDLCTNNSTTLQRIRPQLSGKGKLTTAMMVAELGASIDFLQGPMVNPSIFIFCGSAADVILGVRSVCRNSFTGNL
ncbi:hypothetical protein BTUL_0047g00270 [Botrytis tulipae]|uniref:Uncharacterized protein n=1 Tax=Botrytis tulipae TaxID=87230 RepID=A0A4Z1ERL4_9HELO|nr:hypothetical protein BTUL_0047g00270 [Botrytis tulipae]